MLQKLLYTELIMSRAKVIMLNFKKSWTRKIALVKGVLGMGKSMCNFATIIANAGQKLHIVSFLATVIFVILT